jgi:hypothetical protein
MTWASDSSLTEQGWKICPIVLLGVLVRVVAIVVLVLVLVLGLVLVLVRVRVLRVLLLGPLKVK